MSETKTTTNTAESGSNVGIQAEQVHNSTVYQVLPDDPPDHKYRVGVSYLENGVPLRARELITDAIARGYENAEVRFHWVLAMLSKRSYRDLTADERTELERLPAHLAKYSDGRWKRALEAVAELLSRLDDPEGNPGLVLEMLKALETQQREAIVRHCGLVLNGTIKDSFWAETARSAHHGQLAGDRGGRAWAFFKPSPIPARVLQPADNATTPSDHLRAIISTGLLSFAVGYLGWILLQHPTPMSVIAYPLVLAAGCVAAKTGLEWRYRTQRRSAKDRKYFGRVHDHDTLEPGFAKRVDHYFDYCSHKYVPKDVEKAVWLGETRGVRRALRDEVVELYRESRIPLGRVTWLIRFLVLEVGRDWKNGTLFAYRQQYRTPSSTKTWCVLALAGMVLTASAVVEAATRTEPLTAWAATLLALASGRVATVRWLHIVSERRRFAEETQECAGALAAREAAYHRWKSKLEATCPDESEMEAWLECDKALLVDEALRHYRLAWRDIIAQAIVQTPAGACDRARVKGGPWRYSKYDLHLFLITKDGVRELARQLDFKHASFDGHTRGHFRFDAVSSLHVSEASEYEYTLELTLTNGPTRTIEVAEPERNLEQPAENEPGLSQISLDSTGFAHALHVLEGIAAEGKAWIERDTPTSDPLNIASGVSSFV